MPRALPNTNVMPGTVSVTQAAHRRARRRSRARSISRSGAAGGVGNVTTTSSSTTAHLGTSAFMKMDPLTAYTRGRIHGIVDEYSLLGNMNFQQAWKNLGF